MSKERDFIYRPPFVCVCMLINEDALLVINKDALINENASILNEDVSITISKRTWRVGTWLGTVTSHHKSVLPSIMRSSVVLLLSIVLVSASIIHNSSLSAISQRESPLEGHVRAERCAHNSTMPPPHITSDNEDTTQHGGKRHWRRLRWRWWGVQGAPRRCFNFILFLSTNTH